MEESCIFCKIANKDVPAEIVYEDGDIIAFNDLNPQAPMHVLLIPKKHIRTVNELEEEDMGLIGKIVSKAKDLAGIERIDKDGYRLVINCNRGAGQEVFHLHVHLMGGRTFSWPPG
ncbi:MAG: histidine triad nucleotide-binding protein [Candidatus Omnitrophota bacterium]